MRLLACVALMAIALAVAGCGAGSRVTRPTEVIERGWIDRSVLALPTHLPFQKAYDTVQVRTPLVTMIRGVVDSVQTLIVLGTWCPDSRREVPHFLKIADQAGIPPAHIRLYAVDRSKKSDDGLTDRFHIEKVPTFIFLKDSVEVGRIVEQPETTLEGDILTILAKAAARP